MTLGKDTLADLCFFGLNFTIICSLNSLTNIFFGFSQLASPIILVLCIAIFHLCGLHRKTYQNRLVLLFLGTLLIYYLIGTLLRFYYMGILDYQNSFKYVYNKVFTGLILILAYLTYFYYRLVLNRAHNRVLLLLLIPTFLSMCTVVLMPFFGIDSFVESRANSGRVMGVFANPNGAGIVANFGLILFIDFTYRHRKYFLLGLLGILFSFWAGLLTLSRTSIIISLFIVLISALYHLLRPRSYGRYPILQNSFLIGIPFLVANYVILNFERLIYTYLTYGQRSRILLLKKFLIDREVDSSTTSQRSEILQVGLEYIFQRPFLGHGLGFFEDIPGHFGIHNTYLLILGNGGIIPLFLFLSLLVSLSFTSILKKENGFIILTFSMVMSLSYLTSHNGLDDKVMLIGLVTAVAFASFSRKRLPGHHNK